MNAVASSASRPGWFRVVAVLFLLWNLLGVWMFYSQYTMSPDQLAALPEGQQTLWKNMPAWAWVAYGVAVVGGALGALMLLMGKRVALPLFWVSLVAVLAQFSQVFFPGGALEVLGPAMALPMPVSIAVVAALQVWVARKAIARGWIG
jgi:hypothetical protein